MDELALLQSKIDSLEALIRDNINDDTVEMLVILSQIKDDVIKLYTPKKEPISVTPIRVDSQNKSKNYHFLQAKILTDDTSIPSPVGNSITNSPLPPSVFSKESVKIFFNKNDTPSPDIVCCKTDSPSPDIVDDILYKQAEKINESDESNKQPVLTKLEALKNMLQKNNLETKIVQDMTEIILSSQGKKNQTPSMKLNNRYKQ